MEPKSKLEKEVYELHQNLGGYTDKQEAWMKSRLPKRAINNKGNVRCMACGHSFKAEYMNIDGTIVCPECGTRLKVEHSTAAVSSDSYYMMITQTVGTEWQVFRYFYVERLSYREGNFSIEIYEVLQNWMNSSNQHVYLSRSIKMFPNRLRQPYRLDTPLSIHRKHGSYGCYYSYDFSDLDYSFLRIEGFQKFLTMRGLTAQRSGNKLIKGGWYIESLASNLFKHPMLEIMYKRNMHTLINALGKHHYFAYYAANEYLDKALHTAIKHNYFDTKNFELDKWHKKTKDNMMVPYLDWIDYIGQMKELGKDISHPHFACPENLAEAHRASNRKIEKMNKIKDLARKLEEARSLEDNYQHHRRRFLDIDIVDEKEKLHIRVLPTVDEFKREGETLHHCVFGSSYFDMKKHPTMLILSARIGDDWNNPDEFLETIEVDLADYKVMQCRGLQNEDSRFHEKIVAMVSQNMEIIREHNLKAA